LSIDTSIVPLVDERDTARVDGAAGLMASIVRSRQVEACFSAQFVRFSFGKVDEDIDSQGCALSAIEKKARAGGTLKDLIHAL